MVSAQEIRDIKFGKSFGGYKTDEVDTFLDECADTVEALCRENEENVRKMQVLAETVVEYRNQEDSIRSALINAQRMSESVVAEAQQKAAEIIAQAHDDAEKALERANADIATEKAELERVRSEVASFKSRLLSLYREHLTLIGVLEDESPDDEQVNASAEAQAPVATESPAQPVEETLVMGVEEEPKIDLSSFELQED